MRNAIGPREPLIEVKSSPKPRRRGRRSHGFPARPAELDELRVESAAALTADPDFGSAGAFAVSRGVPRGTRHDADEKEDPPEADEPSADAGEDTADHEQDDRAHEGAQDAQHATAGEGCADRPGDEAEER